MKFKVEDPEDWALLNFETGKWLDPEMMIGNCQLKHMVVNHLDSRQHLLLFQKKPEKGTFGVDFQSLPKSDDPNGNVSQGRSFPGYTIPTALATLKESLYQSNGLEKVGIFRSSGDRLRAKRFRQRLNMNFKLNATPDDAHVVGSLLVEWFRRLPYRLLATETFQFENVKEAKEVVNRLPEPFQSLFQWLLELLIQTAQLRNQNKMSPVDLGNISNTTHSQLLSLLQL